MVFDLPFQSIKTSSLAPGIGLQTPKGIDLPDLDAVLDCDEEIGITVDGQPIRDPPGPEGLPLIGSYYEVFPDHLVSELSTIGLTEDSAGLQKLDHTSTFEAI